MNIIENIAAGLEYFNILSYMFSDFLRTCKGQNMLRIYAPTSKDQRRAGLPKLTLHDP